MGLITAFVVMIRARVFLKHTTLSLILPGGGGGDSFSSESSSLCLDGSSSYCHSCHVYINAISVAKAAKHELTHLNGAHYKQGVPLL